MSSSQISCPFLHREFKIKDEMACHLFTQLEPFLLDPTIQRPLWNTLFLLTIASRHKLFSFCLSNRNASSTVPGTSLPNFIRSYMPGMKSAIQSVTVSQNLLDPTFECRLAIIAVAVCYFVFYNLYWIGFFYF